MDIIDHTDLMMEQLQEARINKIRAQKATLKGSGFCLYCQEPLPDMRPFCDADCRDDHETLNAAKLRNRGG